MSADGAITVNPSTGARTLNARMSFFYYATYITPAMSMRLTDIGSQYLGAFVDSNGEYFDGGKTYKVTLPPNIPAGKFWSFTVYDNQTRSMLDTPQRYPRAGSQSYPTPAAVATPMAPRPCISARESLRGSSDGNWIQTMPERVEHAPAPLQSARNVLHEGVAAERDRTGPLRQPRSASREYPLLAQSGHRLVHCTCPLLDPKRTSRA